jgi:hypothetical protein
VPLIIPPFTQFQGSLFPLRGLWNHAPGEGDRLISVEIDWGSYPPGQAVQLSLSGNSPVAFSQIVALTVDNARCGSDVQFVFSDSGHILQVPAHCQGTFPVFTNSLNFFMVALNAAPNDITCAMIHNSMPPPVAMLPSSAQNSAAVIGFPIANGSIVVVPATVNGTLRGGNIQLNFAAFTPPQVANLSLRDGHGNNLWFGQISPSPNSSIVIPLDGLNVRFFQGLNFVIAASTITAGSGGVNVYYTVP